MNFKRFESLLPDNPLCGISTYKDTLDLSNGSVSRYIRKTILTGNEKISTQKDYYRNNTALFVFRGYSTGYNKRDSLNSHFVSITTNPQTTNYESSGFNESASYSDYYYMRINCSTIGITGNELNTVCVNAFKTWLAQQYANGTPVTIWYYVSNPTTETVTVPTGLSGTEEGYLNRSGTPTLTTPIYPTANEVKVWHDIPYYQHKTATDTLTLPAVIYPNDTSITVGIKGNTTQSGTPSPQNPVVISGTGDLETTGEHAGQYKIPISSAGQTTPVYLGEVQTTRKIKKLVLTGNEIVLRDKEREGSWRFFTDELISAKGNPAICSHFENISNYDVNNSDNIGFSIFNNTQFGCRCPKSIADTVSDFKSYLAAQYVAGTPVTVWYVLATEETGIVNEPLMKIREYADTVSGITIPTIAGANTLSVGTTVQPSEVSVNYKGWHPVQSVHERENGQWD